MVLQEKGDRTWIKIGESSDRRGDFPVPWDTAKLENRKYEVLGVMHIWAGKGDHEVAVARQNIVEVTVEN
ncbi:MAG: hypothetical protein JSV55_13590 [Deltaproteobacteria bacterium]|nr:MAG: hypothetical protein JSV55_13590 [Deltaproteobacteria bacterium]